MMLLRRRDAFAHGSRLLVANVARWAGLGLVSISISAAAAPESAATDRSLEIGVKAAFLYKFAGYVTWPNNAFKQPDAPIVIGVAIAPAVADELERIVPGRRIKDRPITVKRLKEGEPLSGVHILFVGATERGRAAALLQTTQSMPVLVVTEQEGALALGSGLNFLISEGRVRFEASPEAVEKAGLKLSSRLLSVATNTRGGSSP